MADNVPRLVRAWLESPTHGVVEFDRDWTLPENPSVVLSEGGPEVVSCGPASALTAGGAYGYCCPEPGVLAFVLPIRGGSEIDPDHDTLYVAGDFSGWKDAVGNPRWRMDLQEIDGQRVFIWRGPAQEVLSREARRFKFITGEQIWLHVPEGAPNAAPDGPTNVNRFVDPARLGRHLWRFDLASAADLSRSWSAGIAAGGNSREAPAQGRAVPLVPGGFFFELASELALGAIAEGDGTVFRLFAPRARSVTLFASETGASRKDALRFPLQRRDDADGAAGVWEVEMDRNLHGWRYWYSVDGEPRGSGGFNPDADILDPYALAAVDRTGPGIVIDRSRLLRRGPTHRTPAWQDLVVVEGHIRDLAANAPSGATPGERLGFTGLRKWVESPNFYLHHLGVNCVELQPIHKFDNRTAGEYHWGYMPVSWFAPESSYSLAPEEASGIREFQELVDAFHKRGMAVILDVVYNHVGEPPHLMGIDRLYYFEQDKGGRLANWSGCGNDFRASSAMGRRMIIDSMVHLVETFGVDGFRLDLAELLGVDVLRDIDAALKRVKPNVILIAEPWSFRGHIAGALRETGFSSWNDGYRDTLRAYVRGGVPADRMEYFLRGSPWYFAKWPAQTVNYVESHDDMTFIDAITENPGSDGFIPTANDIRRARLMAAVLFMSVGIPMLSAGQDFLRSKRGVSNTYQRGDLNALDYARLFQHQATHAYFSDWIAFRLGPRGRVLRHFSRASEEFFRFFKTAGAAPFAVLCNADRSHPGERLLFAVNPTLADARIPLDPDVAWSGTWRQLADHERFIPPGSRAATRPVEPDMDLPPLSCALWSAV